MSDKRIAMANGVSLASVFREDCIVKVPRGWSKEQVLERLLNSLVDAHMIPSVQVPTLLGAIMERERVGTTALGKGLAIPHLRSHAVYRFIGAIGLAPDGVDFQSLDGAATKVVLMVLGPFEQRERHFELMGRLSTFMRDKAKLVFLQGGRTPREVVEFLQDLDVRGSEATGAAIECSPASASATRSTLPVSARRT